MASLVYERENYFADVAVVDLEIPKLKNDNGHCNDNARKR